MTLHDDGFDDRAEETAFCAEQSREEEASLFASCPPLYTEAERDLLETWLLRVALEDRRAEQAQAQVAEQNAAEEGGLT